MDYSNSKASLDEDLLLVEKAEIEEFQRRIDRYQTEKAEEFEKRFNKHLTDNRPKTRDFKAIEEAKREGQANKENTQPDPLVEEEVIETVEIVEPK